MTTSRTSDRDRMKDRLASGEWLVELIVGVITFSLVYWVLDFSWEIAALAAWFDMKLCNIRQAIGYPDEH